MIAGVEDLAHRPVRRLREIELLLAHAAVARRIRDLEIEQIGCDAADCAARGVCVSSPLMSAYRRHDVLRETSGIV